MCMRRRGRSTVPGTGRKTRRVQILMDPAEYAEIAKVARERKKSVAELIREAVRERGLATRAPPRTGLADTLAAMQIPLPEDWATIKEEIVSRYDERYRDLP